MDDRVAVDVRTEVWRAPAKNCVGRGAVGQHEQHDPRAGEHLDGAGRHLRAGGMQRLAPLSGAVPDDKRRPGAGEVERHGLTHDTQTNEAHGRCPLPVWPVAVRSGIVGSRVGRRHVMCGLHAGDGRMVR